MLMTATKANSTDLGLYSIKIAARKLGLTTSAIYNAIARGAIKPLDTSIGRAISIDEIKRYRKENLGRRGRPKVVSQS